MPNLFSLEKDILDCQEASELFKDDAFAVEVWESLANITWVKTPHPKMTDAELSAILAEENQFSHSWRGAGGVIAAIRNTVAGTNENYMHWYCSGDSPGRVTDRVLAMFKSLNWEPLNDEYYRKYNP